MLAIRSTSSSVTLASTGTRTSRFSIIRSRSCSCTSLASIASVNSYLLEVIVISVRGGKRTRKQRCEVQKSILVQMWFVLDLNVSAGRRQHPNRDLQPTTARVHDSDCTIASLRSADDSECVAMQWMERVENLNVSRFRTQGTVGAGVSIHTSIALFRQAVSLQTEHAGSIRAIGSSFR